MLFRSPNVQLAGPSVLARPLVQPAEDSCFLIGNTALQPARPAGPPFSVILQGLVISVCMSFLQLNDIESMTSQLL